MKKQLLILLCFLPLAISAQKNIFQWQPARYDATQALAAELDHWEIFQINPEEMSRLARQYPHGVDMSWQWAGGELAFHLFADDIRGSQYRSADLGSEGVKELPAGPNITYGGRVEDGGSMRLTLHENYLFGYWEKDGHTWFVQPLSHFVPDAPEHHFVVYKTSDVKPVPNAHCGWTHAESHRKQHAEDAQHAKMVGECYDVEIAIASDFLMFQFFGTVGAVQDFTIGVLNTVQTNYDNDFADEIRFVVVANIVSSCSTCDPWTSSTSSNELLVSFRAWGNGGGFGLDYDVASLWSDRDFNGNTIGLAWVGALCSGSRYNILERFTSNSAFLRNLQSHELGHNFDADHDAEGSPTIMGPSVSGSNNWSALSLNVINNYIAFIAAQGDCFSECGGSQPLAPVAQIQLPVTHICPGSVVPLIDNSIGTPTSWNWGLSGATPPSSFLQSPTVTYDNPGIYPVLLTVSNSVGSDTQFSTTDITVDENGQKFLLYETFENQILYWDVVNPDNNVGWDVREVGGSPYGNKAAYINAAGYSGSGQVDGMISPSFSLSGVSNPILKIDYAYRRRTSSGSEQLRIKVSTNGGASFPNTIFSGQENGSGNFATGGVLGSAFTPASTSDWCYTGNPGSATCIELNLSQFIGNNDVRILIESVNAGNNNLYVDNVRLEVDCQAALPPVAAIGALPVSGCAPLTVSFQDNSTGIVDHRVWSFPGGTPATSSDAFPVVTYQQPGTYNVVLEVFNGAGPSFVVESNLIEVLTVPITDFSFVANGSTVQFTNNSQGQGSVLWNFGNGQTSIQNNPAHTYAQPGTYTVRLTTSNSCGETIKERTVVIAAPPVAAFSITQQGDCSPVAVSFSNTSTGNPTNYNWSFPGGTPATSAAASPSVTYQQPGTYTATLIVSNPAGTDTISQSIVVGSLPLADFDFNYVIGQHSAAFSNQSAQADSVRWLASGQTSTADNVVFEFPEDGMYTVQLIAYNHCGNDTTSQTITIVTPPAAGFSPDAGTGCAPSEVVFENQSSQNAATFAWSFPGGTPATSTAASPSVTYQQPGTYSATLIVGNPAGADTISQSIVVGGLPLADFDFNYVIGQHSAAFSNQSTQADSVHWLAAGQTSTADNVVFEFPEDGMYTVQLIAYNHCGNDTTSQIITIVTPPAAGFSPDAGTGCAPAEVVFENQSSQNATTFDWSFPGGTPATSTTASPSVTYQQPGTYTATLIVGNPAGADTISQSIVVGGLPSADFDFDYIIGANSAAFSNQSAQADSVRWQAAGQTSTADNIVFEFPEDGTYIVQLIAYNHCGNDTTSQTITIVTPPAAGFSPDAGTGCAPSEVVFENQSSQNATTFAWSFPGGTPATSTAASPSVTYQQPGTYTATLIVSNPAGTDTISQSIVVGSLPLADFDFNYVIGQHSAAFSNQSAQADSVRWQASGQTSTADNVVFEFPEDGTYTVQLIAYNRCGNDTTSQIITIVTPPAAGFSPDAGTGCAPAEVVFENQSSQNATTFAWSFPSGTPATSAAASPSVTYQQPGTYTATLIVGNPAGADTISQSIVVGGLPTGTLSAQVNGSQVTVQVNAFNATVLSWNFGDGNESTEANPTHTYTADGDYLITLTLGNVCGQTILTNTVTINTALPVAGFSSGNRQGCAPLEVIFSNESSANAQTFVWQFPGGNPETSTETHPRIIYEIPGVYTVSLTAGNSNGGSAITRMDYVVVRGLPTAGFSFQMTEAEVAFQTTATQEPGTSYRWDFGDGNISELPAPTHTYSAGGNYTVSLELSNECGSIVSTMEVSIIINHTGEAPLENGWSVYPNPSSGRVVVFKDQIGAREPLEWVLRDVLGHTLKRVRLDAAGGELRQAIDLGGLPSGVYVWSVVGAGDQTISGAGKLVVTQ